LLASRIDGVVTHGSSGPICVEPPSRHLPTLESIEKWGCDVDILGEGGLRLKWCCTATGLSKSPWLPAQAGFLTGRLASDGKVAHHQNTQLMGSYRGCSVCDK